MFRLIICYLLSFLYPTCYIFSQCSNDSIVIHYGYEYDSNSNYWANSVDVLDYNLDSGFATTSSYLLPHGGTWQAATITTGTYSKTDTMIDQNGWPDEFYTRNGNGNGWTPVKQIKITYNGSYYRTGLYNLNWTGVLWDTASCQIWTYDSLNRIISSEFFIQNNVSLVKQYKVDINYMNDLIDTKIHYNSDSTNSWINFRKYQFFYTNGLRTSADVYDADSIGNWIILGSYQYFLNDSNQYVIRLQNINQLSTYPQLSDTLFLDLDTLENVIHSFGWHFINPGQAYYVIDYYLLSDSAVIPLYTYNVLCENWPIDTVWDPIERANQDWYTYDSNNHVLIHTVLGTCTNPCGSDISYSYDSFGRIIHAENYFWTMVYDHDDVDDYVYFDSAELKIIVPPIEDNQIICPDSSFQPNILIAGGCTPYHIQWQPSIGLSSDTVIQPSITVTNPITYTIYANDDYGHYDTAYYTISPFTINNQISIVNQYCDGSAQLSLHPVYGAYEWYFDSTSIFTNTTGLCNASLYGNYWCYILFQINGYHDFSCSVQSNTFVLSQPVPPTLILSGDTLYCSNMGSSFEWFHDSLYFATTIDSFLIANLSGDYYVIVNDTNGCTNTTNVVNVLILSTPEHGVESFSINDHPDNNSIIIINSSHENDFNLSISDVSGKVVMIKKLGGRKNDINLEIFSPGIYFIRIEQGNVNYTKKVLRK